MATTPIGLHNRVAQQRDGPGRGQLGIQLAQRAGGRVAWVDIGLLALRRSSAFMAFKVLSKDHGLAAHDETSRRAQLLCLAFLRALVRAVSSLARATGMRSGSERMVRRLGVISSPTSPSPRVAPRTKCRFRNAAPRSGRRSLAPPRSRPSPRGRPGGGCARTRRARSSALKALPRLRIGAGWRTLTNFSDTCPPTRRVGEFGWASSGCSASRACSSRKSVSYSTSEISGAASTW